MLSLEDWKPLGKAEYTQATEEDLKKYFDDATDSKDEINFTQYEEVMKKMKDASARLRKELATDPDFKKFYDADKEKKNDELLTLNDFKPLALGVF